MNHNSTNPTLTNYYLFKILEELSESNYKFINKKLQFQKMQQDERNTYLIDSYFSSLEHDLTNIKASNNNLSPTQQIIINLLETQINKEKEKLINQKKIINKFSFKVNMKNFISNIKELIDQKKITNLYNRSQTFKLSVIEYNYYIIDSLIPKVLDAINDFCSAQELTTEENKEIITLQKEIKDFTASLYCIKNNITQLNEGDGIKINLNEIKESNEKMYDFLFSINKKHCDVYKNQNIEIRENLAHNILDNFNNLDNDLSKLELTDNQKKLFEKIKIRKDSFLKELLSEKTQEVSLNPDEPLYAEIPLPLPDSDLDKEEPLYESIEDLYENITQPIQSSITADDKIDEIYNDPDDTLYERIEGLYENTPDLNPNEEFDEEGYLKPIDSKLKPLYAKIPLPLPDLGEGEPVYESIEDLYKNRTYLNIEEEYDDSDQEYDEPQKIEQDIYQSLVQYNQGEEFNREYDVPEENNVELNQVDLESIEQNTKHEQGNSKTLLEIKLDEIQKALDTSFVIKHELIKDFPFKQESQIGIEQNIRAKMLEYIKPWEKKVDTFFNGKEDRITKGAIEKFIKIKDNLRNFQNVIVEEYKSLSEKINQDRKTIESIFAKITDKKIEEEAQKIRKVFSNQVEVIKGVECKIANSYFKQIGNILKKNKAYLLESEIQSIKNRITLIQENIRNTIIENSSNIQSIVPAEAEKEKTASTSNSSVEAGKEKNASTSNSSVEAEKEKTASTDNSSVEAGKEKTASTSSSSVEAGKEKTASTSNSSVEAEKEKTASTSNSLVEAEKEKTASTSNSSVEAEKEKTASTDNSSVEAGKEKTASTSSSSVEAGKEKNASTSNSSVEAERATTASTSSSLVEAERATTASTSSSSRVEDVIGNENTNPIEPFIKELNGINLNDQIQQYKNKLGSTKKACKEIAKKIWQPQIDIIEKFIQQNSKFNTNKQKIEALKMLQIQKEIFKSLEQGKKPKIDYYNNKDQEGLINFNMAMSILNTLNDIDVNKEISELKNNNANEQKICKEIAEKIYQPKIDLVNEIIGINRNFGNIYNEMEVSRIFQIQKDIFESLQDGKKPDIKDNIQKTNTNKKYSDTQTHKKNKEFAGCITSIANPQDSTFFYKNKASTTSPNVASNHGIGNKVVDTQIIRNQYNALTKSMEFPIYFKNQAITTSRNPKVSRNHSTGHQFNTRKNQSTRSNASIKSVEFPIYFKNPESTTNLKVTRNHSIGHQFNTHKNKASETSRNREVASNHSTGSKVNPDLPTEIKDRATRKKSITKYNNTESRYK